MFRLLLKVRSIHLRLKEEVDVQILIKKGQESIIIPKKAKLINGTADFSLHSEFFVSSNSPIFQIYVMILYGSTKKLAGMCEINLNQWEQNANHSTISQLGKSPDASAKIDYDFLYLSSDIQVQKKNLISLNELESIKKSILIKQMQDKNIFLVHENDRLNKQIVAVKRQNNQLVLSQNQMSQHFQRTSEDYEKKLNQKSLELEYSQHTLHQMKEKMTKIQEIINELGQSSLKFKMETIMGQDSDHQM